MLRRVGCGVGVGGGGWVGGFVGGGIVRIRIYGILGFSGWGCGCVAERGLRCWSGWIVVGLAGLLVGGLSESGFMGFWDLQDGVAGCFAERGLWCWSGGWWLGWRVCWWWDCQNQDLWDFGIYRMGLRVVLRSVGCGVDGFVGGGIVRSGIYGILGFSGWWSG